MHVVCPAIFLVMVESRQVDPRLVEVDVGQSDRQMFRVCVSSVEVFAPAGGFPFRRFSTVFFPRVRCGLTYPKYSKGFFNAHCSGVCMCV